MEQKNLLRSELTQYQDELSRRTSDYQELTLKVKVFGKEVQSLRIQLGQERDDKIEAESKMLKILDQINKTETEKEELLSKYLDFEGRLKQAELTIQVSLKVFHKT